MRNCKTKIILIGGWSDSSFVEEKIAKLELLGFGLDLGGSMLVKNTGDVGPALIVVHDDTEEKRLKLASISWLKVV